MTNQLDQQYIEQNTVFEVVPTSKMFVAKYGRPLVVAKVQTMVRLFDKNGIGTIYLSLRSDGQYAILDGQHRVAAANLKGLYELPSLVFIDLTYEEEAALYVKFATVNQQSSLDKFKARVEAREPTALDIVDLLDSCGSLYIAYNGPADHGIQAVSLLENLYRKNGRAHLRHVLTTIYRTWQGTQRAYTYSVVQGISAFLLRYEGLTVQDDGVKLDWQRLTQILQRMTPEGLIAKATQLQGLMSKEKAASAAGQIILHEYNKGLKTHKLPDWTAQRGK